MVKINVIKDISLGNIITIIIFVVGFAGLVYTTSANVTHLKETVPTLASKESVTQMQQDIRDIRNDIRRLTELYVQQAVRPSPQSSRAGKTAGGP